MALALHASRALPGRDLGQQLALGVLDALSVGVVIVDSRAAILHANDSAAELVAERDGLQIHDGHILAAWPAQTRLLKSLIAQSADPDIGRGGALSLPRPSGLRSYMVLVSPLTAGAALYPDEPLALLFIRDPERGLTLPIQAVCCMLGLTPAEARLAIALAHGATLDDASRSLRVSRNTVRTHLQHIFHKTGINRQSELVLLMSQLGTVRTR